MTARTNDSRAERSGSSPTEPSAEVVIAPTKPLLRGWIHTLLLPAAVIAGVVLVAFGGTLGVRLASGVFVVTASLLFGISATYHRGHWTPRTNALLKRFDHANIFLIIAGTSTPLAVALLPPRSALILLLVSWSGALIGVAFRMVWLGAPRWLYVPAYIALGWVSVFYLPEFAAAGGVSVAVLIIMGGVFYTAGAVVYGTRRPNPSPRIFGFHEIFHAMTALGFACHFVAVWIAVIAAA